MLSSIQTGKPSPALLSQQPASPAPSSTPRNNDRKPAPASRDPSIRESVSGGTKRKAEDQLLRPPRPSTEGTSKSAGPRPNTVPAASKSPRSGPPYSGSKVVAPKPAPKPGTTATTKTATAKTAPAKPAPAPSKPPPKGSYAEIMMKAKQLQEKAPKQAGMFRHQAVPKQRLSRMERKKRALEAQAKETYARAEKKSESGAASKGKQGAKDPDEPSYKGTAKPSQRPEQPSYRGTAGKSLNRGATGRDSQSRSGKQSRVNEYLGTDEEDEGDYDGFGDYYSDQSSDMEAGLNDVEKEEAAALKVAQREDEEELRLEMAAKKEKMERQRKLAALASRTKR